MYTKTNTKRKNNTKISSGELVKSDNPSVCGLLRSFDYTI